MNVSFRSHAKNDITIIIIIEGVNISLQVGQHRAWVPQITLGAKLWLRLSNKFLTWEPTELSAKRTDSQLAQLTASERARGKHSKMATCHEKSRLLLSFFPFFSRAHTRKSQWVVTVTKYRSLRRGSTQHGRCRGSDSMYTYYNATYSVLMLTKQDYSLAS